MLHRPDCDGCDAVVRSRVGRGFGDDGSDFCHHCTLILDKLHEGQS